MKRILSILLIFILAANFNCFAQNENSVAKIEKFIHMYGDNYPDPANSKFLSNIRMTYEVLKSLSQGEETNYLIQDIEYIDILSAKKPESVVSKVVFSLNDFNSNLETVVFANAFERILVNANGSNKAEIWKANDNKTLIAVNYKPEETVILTIVGNINADIIAAVINGKIKIK